MARTTIARGLIEMIKVGKADKHVRLRALAAASDGAERLRKGKPAVTVRFEKLRAHDPEHVERALARGTAHASPIVEPIYDVVVESSLYALTDANRVDVLRFGRHPDQDVQLLDMRVSREHGLVIYSERLPLFCDYGTLIEGKHGGSTNGTYLDGDRPIRDTMIEWIPSMSLQLGTGYTDRNGTPVFGYRITYELHTFALPVDDGFGN